MKVSNRIRIMEIKQFSLTFDIYRRLRWLQCAVIPGSAKGICCRFTLNQTPRAGDKLKRLPWPRLPPPERRVSKSINEQVFIQPPEVDCSGVMPPGRCAEPPYRDKVTDIWAFPRPSAAEVEVGQGSGWLGGRGRGGVGGRARRLENKNSRSSSAAWTLRAGTKSSSFWGVAQRPAPAASRSTETPHWFISWCQIGTKIAEKTFVLTVKKKTSRRTAETISTLMHPGEQTCNYVNIDSHYFMGDMCSSCLTKTPDSKNIHILV